MPTKIELEKDIKKLERENGHLKDIIDKSLPRNESKIRDLESRLSGFEKLQKDNNRLEKENQDFRQRIDQLHRNIQRTALDKEEGVWKGDFEIGVYLGRGYQWHLGSAEKTWDLMEKVRAGHITKDKLAQLLLTGAFNISSAIADGLEHVNYLVGGMEGILDIPQPKSDSLQDMKVWCLEVTEWAGKRLKIVEDILEQRKEK